VYIKATQTTETGMKIINLRLTEEQHAAIEAAAKKLGLGVSTFMRMASIRDAEILGFHPEQPKAD
jgi:uncharacterized protein (DUF1778 family)